MASRERKLGMAVIVAVLLLAPAAWAAGPAVAPAAIDPAAVALLKQWGVERGIAAVVGLPQGGATELVDLVRGSELTVCFQSSRADEVSAVRDAAADAGLLGTRIFADCGDYKTIHLADNLADTLLVAPALEPAVDEAELLRVVHPGAVASVREDETGRQCL